MVRTAHFLATLMIAGSFSSTTLADTRASFTFTGVVPVKCASSIGSVSIADGRAEIVVDQTCNTRHALNFSLSSNSEREIRATYNGVAFSLTDAPTSLPQGWYVEEQRSLVISVPGADASEMEQYVATIMVQLDVG